MRPIQRLREFLRAQVVKINRFRQRLPQKLVFVNAVLFPITLLASSASLTITIRLLRWRQHLPRASTQQQRRHDIEIVTQEHVPPQPGLQGDIVRIPAPAALPLVIASDAGRAVPEAEGAHDAAAHQQPRDGGGDDVGGDGPEGALGEGRHEGADVAFPAGDVDPRRRRERGEEHGVEHVRERRAHRLHGRLGSRGGRGGRRRLRRRPRGLHGAIEANAQAVQKVLEVDLLA
mmetsp:Transcript_16696/g.35258  ORF Transcript_16696/g.35258 Transcript_16696/m.35258 type:complete len:232 (+) Transcript_16696:6402-7097(+)